MTLTASIEQRSAPKGSFPTCCQTPGTTFERPCSPSRCSPGSRSVCTRVPACKFTSTLARKMHDNYPQPVGPFVVHQSTAARMAFQLQAITIPLARHPSFRRNRTLRTIDIFLFLSLSLLAVFFAAFFFFTSLSFFTRYERANEQRAFVMWSRRSRRAISLVPSLCCLRDTSCNLTWCYAFDLRSFSRREERRCGCFVRG